MTPKIDCLKHRITREQPKGYRPRRRKRKFFACLLSALFPGLGHLYLGMILKGIFFIYFVLIDASALIYFSSVRMAINVPLLILLGLLIPVAYFYSIYDVLQSTDAFNSRIKKENDDDAVHLSGTESTGLGASMHQGIRASALLISGGLLLVLLQRKPLWLQELIQSSSAYLVASALIAVASFELWRERKRRFLRTGRFTAASLLIAVSVLLVIDEISGKDRMLLMLTWWPLVFVLWGLEHIAVLLLNHRNAAKTGRRLRVDVRGLIFSMFMAFSVFAVTQQDHYMHLWNRVSLDLTAAGAEYSNDEGYRVEKPSLDIPIDLDTNRVIISGLNGNIEVRKAETTEIIVKPIIWIDQLPSEEAREIAADTSVEVNEGKSLELSVKDKAYGKSGRRHPRVNLTVILPENRFLDLDITTSNGGIALTSVQAMKEVKLQTGNGDLRLWDVIGNVSGKTLNGDVELYRIFGDAEIDTQGGNVKGRGVTGKAALSTMVGDISLTDAQAEIQVNTKNGNIRIDGASAKLQAESLNGKVHVSSKKIGGNWDVYSAVGEMQVDLPDVGDYTFEGSSSYGDIFTNLPFAVEDKEIKGTMGRGEYQVKVEGNSNLIVNKS